MKQRTILSLITAAALALTACGGGGDTGGTSTGTGGAAAAGEPQQGGELTVLEDAAFAGAWPTGLDPATNTNGGANISIQQAIYGGLFLLQADEDGSNAEIVPNQAESFELSPDGTQFTVTLREGLEFSDGTPMDAEAVRFNWERAFASACTCKPTWQLADPPMEVLDPLTIRLNFAAPNASVLASFPASNVNWIGSPTAIQAAGDDFAINPVGAGPFTVVENQLSTLLRLERNETYFKEGQPYLDRLTFQSIGGDQPAYQAIQAGQAQVYEGMSTTPLIEQAQANDQLQVTVHPATSPYVVQLNTKAGPFTDPRAREAIYRATDFDAINEGLFGGQYPPSQSFTGPGGLFYMEDVEGYPEYDLERARELVEEIGGLQITLGTLGAYVATQVNTALETQWEEAGIDVTIEDYSLNILIQEFVGGQWDAMLQTAGAWDPAAGVGVAFRFASTSPFSGVADPELDQLLADAAATVDEAERADLYQQAAQRIAENFYAPFGLAFAPATLSVAGVHGPGVDTQIPPILVNPGIIWDEVWQEQ